MPTSEPLPPLLEAPLSTRPSRSARPSGVLWNCASIVALVLAITLTAVLSGCGTSGYAGTGITSLSSTSVTLDAGQAVNITANLSGDETTPTWSLAGGSCSGSTCGTLSATTGAEITYTAPAVTAQTQVTLTSAITGTTNSKTVSITVNPDPTITGTLPAGTVGTAYSATLTPSGGTGTLTMSLGSGSTLPAGLTFDASTGVISGTPTTAGTSTFVIQVVDQSVTPDTVSVNESITISTSGSTTTSLSLTGGAQPAGTVGTAYTTTLTATGGTAPYTYSIASGTLPAGLSISASTGVISGTPTTAGSSTFEAEVTDSTGATATASASITINTASSLTLTVTTLPGGTVGVPYTGTIGASGGTAPYSCSITSGTLPAGLTLSGCTVSGTPTTPGTSTVTVTVTDSGNPTKTGSGPVTIVISSANLTLTSTTLPNGTVGVAYSATIGASGGTTPYSCAIASGTLPAGLTLSGCTVSGTPTTAGTSTPTVTVTDSSSSAKTVTGPETIVISAANLTLTSTTLPNGTVGVAYSATIGASGGTTPYSCAIASGTLPAGLTLSGCTVSGTPTTAGTSTPTVTVTDSSSPAKTATGPETIVISPASLSITGTLPGGTVGTPYSGTITASGGTTPYSCSVTAGALPAGLTLSGCTVSGTPTTTGTSNVTVTVTDSGSPAKTANDSQTITIAPATLTLSTSSLPNGTVGVTYSATIGASGGVSPYSCTITSGTLPAGLTLGAGCAVSGTPTTAGTSTVSVKVTDAASPADNATGSETIVIVPANLTIAGTLPGGTVGTPYSTTITATGGTTPYSCSITGTLPAGLTLSGCTVSGTPTTAGNSNVTVTVTDSSSPAKTATETQTVTIAAATLTATVNLPAGTVGTAYTGTITATGGTTPYTCAVTSGQLPAGLTLTGCSVSGTPTTAGSSNVTVTVTDSSSPAKTSSGAATIVISPANLTLSATTLPNGTVGVAYSATIAATGGTTPYTCAITSGTLPAGLTLGTGCTVSGTPTTAGSSTVTVKVTDSSSPAKTVSGPETIVISPATLTLSTTTLPDGTVGVAYSATIGATGGVSPYSCLITGGTLPTGLSLSGCTVSGTPTTPETSTVTVKVTDSASPVDTVTGVESITINSSGALALNATLPNAVVNTAYSYTLVATGGTPTYTYAVTTGTLPAGITLSSAGVLSGTPTATGASSFTVTVTDSKTNTATDNLVLLVTYGSSPYDTELSGPYAYLFQGYDDVVAGVLAYQTATVGSFTADGAGDLSAGELDANHQSTTVTTGNTVTTQKFLGTYIVYSDSTGFITITSLNADGTTDQTSTYAISLRAPVSPATVSTQGSLIEYDDNELVGTEGSGSLLQQTASTFSAGLDGSYAFGLQGDTPCLISCTLGVLSGPVATVGQLTTDGGGSITSGEADTNIAATNYATATLTGSYQAADQNGRLALSLTNSLVTNSEYPTDYAVYVVNANQAFVMSTDVHSAFTLLAGTAQLQTSTSFDNTYLNGPFIGYENTQSNPGLLGVVLQSVLNFSSATIFRQSGDGAGTCDTTNVDSAGLTNLVDNVTGIANGDILLEALLGDASTTGTAACQVTTNGRVELNYPTPSGLISTLLGLLGLPTGAPAPRIVYLTSPGTGYFLESSYAGLGQIEQQTGAPFSLATLDGTYVDTNIPTSSLASITSAGYFTANGKGGATSTLYANVGLGTLNVLQLTTSTPTTYALNDPNADATTTAATAGRYLLGDGSTVVYAISPDRFVLLNTSALTTSPSVSLLY